MSQTETLGIKESWKRSIEEKVAEKLMEGAKAEIIKRDLLKIVRFDEKWLGELIEEQQRSYDREMDSRMGREG